jgi:phosphomannomutase
MNGSSWPEADIDKALEQVRQANQRGDLTDGAVVNLTEWLTQPAYAEYRDACLEHIEQQRWQQLDDVFWTVIPFGTGGRRGRMYPIGSNAINDLTIGQSAQGLADYIHSQGDSGGGPTTQRCAIAYDTRHRSRHFAELCASIMVANGFEVIFLDQYRATPQLSYAVRRFECTCGIMVTASHNPPSDNAVKIYWSTGGQVLPPHDAGIIQRVMGCQRIQRVDFEQALADGHVRIVTEQLDRDFAEQVLRFSWPGSRELKIVFSPLHGVGSLAVLPVLAQAGFGQVLEYPRHAELSGDFPNVPGHVSNPENTAVFDEPIAYARQQHAELILATDPDADRMGCAAPLDGDPSRPWRTLNGNQIGALLTDFVLDQMQQQGRLTHDSYIVKTLVTTELTRRIAESYGVACEGNLHVGFKWIAGKMDERGPEQFVFGTEESHGYLIGQFVRDKDAVGACLLMSQLAAQLKIRGSNLHHRLEQLQQAHGCHLENQLNVQMEGSEGMSQMQRVMTAFRQQPPTELAGMRVRCVRDYQALTERDPAQANTQPLDAPATNMVILDLEPPGNYVAIRPSGTEPKVKFYFFGYLPPEQSQSVPAATARLEQQLKELQASVQQFVASRP